MNELENLRPEVREALDEVTRCTECMHIADYSDAPDIIRAELLRLAGECAMIPRAQLLANFAAANERAERAEAERDELRTAYTSASQSRDYWKECTERAEAELEALKARISQGIVLDVDDLARGHAGLPSEWRGQRVRLVVEG